MALTARDVEQIMQLLDASHFDRLKLELDGISLELERGGSKVSHPAPGPTPAPAPSAPPPAPAPAAKPAPAAASEAGLVDIRSPLLGIYYRAPKPGEPAFVEVGQKVGPESVVGIVEVMKLMNSVPAGISGEIVEILAVNGELVEHEEVLMRVRPDA